MTILQGIDMARSEPNFRDRVLFYVTKAAIAVTTEASGTAFHTQRLALAEQILLNSENKLTTFCLGVVTNSTILSYANSQAIPDGDIEFVVNSIYNSYTDYP